MAAERDLVKQDINFMEFPLWFQGARCRSEELFRWEHPNGFLYRSAGTPPGRVDFLILLAILQRSQQSGWSEEVECSRYDLMADIGQDPKTCGGIWYRRLTESLEKWMEVHIEFRGTFYDGTSYQTLQFGIVDSWGMERDTGRLRIYLSSFWLMHIRESSFFKWIDLNDYRVLTSPLASRLYEILLKNFHGRSTWQIDAVKLAAKIPLKQKYPAHIVPKIQDAVESIRDNTDFNVYLSVRRPKKGKALLVFRLDSEGLASQDSELVQVPENHAKIQELMRLIPAKHRTKKTIISAVALTLKRFGEDHVRRNIEYANRFSKKNYGLYVIKALQGNWASDWEEDKPEAVEPITPEDAQATLPFTYVSDQIDDNGLNSLRRQYAELCGAEELQELEAQVKNNLLENAIDCEQTFAECLSRTLARGIEVHSRRI